MGNVSNSRIEWTKYFTNTSHLRTAITWNEMKVKQHLQNKYNSHRKT